jgi:uncharacterized protein YoxC
LQIFQNSAVIVLALMSIVVLIILVFKELKIHEQKEVFETLAQSYYDVEDNLKESNTILDYYRTKYGYLADEDIKYCVNKWIDDGESIGE